VLTNIDNDVVDQWRKKGVEVHVEPAGIEISPTGSPLQYARAQRRYWRRLRHLIRETGARVVHANDPLALQVAIAPTKLAGARLVFNLRGTIAPDRKAPCAKYRMLFAASDHVLYLSEDMARRWSAVAANATDRCGVTYSIVDFERFKPSPISAGREPIVLVSGVIRPLKGQLDFIREVVPKLAEAGVKVQFSGDFDPATDAYSKACAQAAEPFGEAVTFLGYRNDLPALLREARVLAVPSLHEGLVRGMAEAMACGRPVVSFDVCSAQEILVDESGGAGKVIPLGEFADMGEAILEYCRSPRLASEAGRKGRETARRLFEADEVVERYERVYDVLGAKS
jgi:glycosyltransferase involved in cell wall biosynthesis